MKNKKEINIYKKLLDFGISNGYKLGYDLSMRLNNLDYPINIGKYLYNNTLKIGKINKDTIEILKSDDEQIFYYIRYISILKKIDYYFPEESFLTKVALGILRNENLLRNYIIRNKKDKKEFDYRSYINNKKDSFKNIEEAKENILIKLTFNIRNMIEKEIPGYIESEEQFKKVLYLLGF